MFVKDLDNNIGRGCALWGCLNGRVWQVIRAVSGDRYMVRNVNTGEYRTVHYSLMTNLY